MNDKTATLGEYLKHEREKRNISIEQLAYGTRIGIKMLRALEEDNHAELPAQPFVRGYLQAYAKYVGLDIQDLFLRYQHHLATHPDSKKAALQSHYLYVKERYQERKQLLLVLGLFLTLLVCAGAYFAIKSKKDHNKLAKQIALQEKTNEPGAVATTTAIATSTAISIAHASTNIKIAATASVNTNTNTQSKTVAETTQDTTPKKYKLVLKAGQDVWLRFQVDSEPIKDLNLKGGLSLTLQANKVLKLFSGNLGALQATINGAEVKSLIQPGRAMSAVLPESEVANYPLPLFPSMSGTKSDSSSKTNTSTITHTSTITDTNN